jgi:hypothetical protein
MDKTWYDVSFKKKHRSQRAGLVYVYRKKIKNNSSKTPCQISETFDWNILGRASPKVVEAITFNKK